MHLIIAKLKLFLHHVHDEEGIRPSAEPSFAEILKKDW